MSGSPERNPLESAPTLADPSSSEVDLDEVSLETIDPSHYAIDGDIAQGGMGIVRQALDRRTGRRVALKELLGKLRPQTLQRFRREARITAQLQHPSIVPVYEVGQWPDGRPFFAMKLVGGRPLDAIVEEAADADSRLALVPRILPAVEAIAYAHEQGVIHRDLKPANVLLGEFGETIVIDWGLAKGIGDTDELAMHTGDSIEAALDDDQLTREGAIMGTPAYMPPEQARAEALDARADVYSLGALLYHALSGHPPYETKALQQLLTGPPVPLASRAPDAPPDLVSIVEKAMARDPEDRYRDARELARDLEAFQTGRLVGAYQYTSWELVTRFVRRNRALTAALVTLVVLAVTAGGFVVRGQRLAESERERAVAAEREALAQERKAHERLAQVHWRGAVRRLQRGDHLGAELLAAAAMVESPDHPLGPHRHLGGDRADRLAGPAATWTAARALRFAAHSRTFAGHDDWIYDLIVSDDDRWLVTTAADGRAIIWDLRSGRIHRRLEGHEGSVFQAALDADQTHLATSAYDGKVRLWSFPEGELLRTLDHPSDRAYGLCFAANGKLLAAGGNGQVAIFDPETGALRRAIDATTALPWRLSCARGEPLAAVSTVGPEVALIDARAETVQRRLVAPDTSSTRTRMRAMALGPDEVLTADEEGVLRRFDPSTGALRAQVWVDGAFDVLAVSPDRRWLALGGSEILLVDHDSMRPVARLDGHEGGVVALAFDASGSRLFSGGVDHRVLEWRIPGSRAGGLFLAPSRSRIEVIAQSDDGRWLVGGGNDSSVRVWDTATGREHYVSDAHTAPIRAVVFVGPNTVLTTGMDRTLWRHDLEARSTERLADLPHFGDELSLSPDGETLAIASGDGTILLRDQADGAMRAIPAGEDRAWWVGYDPAGERIASAGFDGRVVLIDPAEARVVRRWEAHESRIYDASWRPDGRELTTVDLDGWLRGWDPRDGARVREWRLLDGEAARSVAWAPTGDRLLVTTDGGARVYGLDGVLEARLDFDGRTTAAGWTRDGRIRFSTDGRVYLLPLDRTPWRRDPRELLAAAERDAGISLDAFMELDPTADPAD